jgi:hypothetical protein
VTHEDHPQPPVPDAPTKADAGKYATAGTLLTVSGTSGHARELRELLDNHQAPVPITLPVFESATTGVSNWSTQEAEDFGTVAEPIDFTVFAGGHAVCVTGFIEVPSEPHGGFFTFRNSWGQDWASSAQFDPRVYRFSWEPGYGSVSASYVDKYLWEACVL